MPFFAFDALSPASSPLRGAIDLMVPQCPHNGPAMVPKQRQRQGRASQDPRRRGMVLAREVRVRPGRRRMARACGRSIGVVDLQ